MRIGLNLLYLIPGAVGGTESYAKGIMGRLFGDRENDYVVFTNANTSRSDLGLPSAVKMITVPVDARSRSRRYLAEQTVLPRLVKTERVDLLHSMGYVAPIWTEVPSVVTIHDVNFRNVRMPLTKRVPLGWFMKQSARHAAAVVTVSDFSKQEICAAFGLDAAKVWVTHNAPNSDVFEPSQPPSQEPAHKPYVFVLSSPSPHKNIDGFIKAFEIIAVQSPGLRLVIAGHLAPTISVPAALKDRIEVLGYVPRATLLDLYRGAACFVMPSFYEGFGIPVIEAMAVGTPVVCSNRAALPEVGGEAAVYFDPVDHAQMATAVLRVLRDSQLAEEMSKSGKERARVFTWAHSAAKTLAVYKAALSGGSIQ